ncbi:hypothetical protein HDV05_007238, partial [Chytridiales sp. JEL 0842]
MPSLNSRSSLAVGCSFLAVSLILASLVFFSGNSSIPFIASLSFLNVWAVGMGVQGFDSIQFNVWGYCLNVNSSPNPLCFPQPFGEIVSTKISLSPSIAFPPFNSFDAYQIVNSLPFKVNPVTFLTLLVSIVLLLVSTLCGVLAATWGERNLAWRGLSMTAVVGSILAFIGLSGGLVITLVVFAKVGSAIVDFAAFQGQGRFLVAAQQPTPALAILGAAVGTALIGAVFIYRGARIGKEVMSLADLEGPKELSTSTGTEPRMSFIAYAPNAKESKEQLRPRPAAAASLEDLKGVSSAGRVQATTSSSVVGVDNNVESNYSNTTVDRPSSHDDHSSSVAPAPQETPANAPVLYPSAETSYPTSYQPYYTQDPSAYYNNHQVQQYHQQQQQTMY